MATSLNAALPVATMLRRRRQRRKAIIGLVVAALATTAIALIEVADAVFVADSEPDTIVVIGGDAEMSLLAGLDQDTAVRRFFFGNPGDVQLMGDWDCDGIDTPGAYRTATGEVFLRNANTPGPAAVGYVFGNPNDTPLVGDFDGDGCDTVSVYRPDQSRVYVSNVLGSRVADSAYYLGDAGDEPFVGDFDGDGTDTVAIHRGGDALVFIGPGSTDDPTNGFSFGNPGDRVIAGDWDGDGQDTIAAYRASEGNVYFRNSNSQGPADDSLYVGRHVTVVRASGIDPRSIVGGSLPTPPPTTTTTTPPATDPTTPPPPVTTTTTTPTAPPPVQNGNVVDIPAGVHFGFSVAAQSDTTYQCATGAILDGQGSTAHAFYGSALNVTITGCEIRNYEPGAQNGAIDGEPGGHLSPDGVARPHRDGGWHVSDVWVHDNDGGGVVLQGNDASIRDSRIGHNTQIGFKFTFGDDQIIEDSEIYQNNYGNQYEWGWEAGGSKNWSTNRMVIRRVVTWGNHGPGIWNDWNNADTVIEDVEAWGNTGPGIFHEISQGAVIRDSYVHDGVGDCSGIWCRAGTGILVANSGFVTVENNVLENLRAGISFLDQNRGVWTNTTAGVVSGNTLTNAGESGSGMDHPCCSTLGTVTWSGNTYISSSGP